MQTEERGLLMDGERKKVRGRSDTSRYTEDLSGGGQGIQGKRKSKKQRHRRLKSPRRQRTDAEWLEGGMKPGV